MLTITSLVALLVSIRLVTNGNVGYGVGLLAFTLFFQFIIHIINWATDDMGEI